MYVLRFISIHAALAQVVWLPLFLLCAADTPTSGESAPDKGKAEVKLPEVRTMDLRVLPYFSVEGEKNESPSLRVDRVENDRIDVAPRLKAERSAGTNANWTYDLSTHFTPDSTQTGLVRSRDQARAGYRFDDGLLWTNFEHDVCLDYGLEQDSKASHEQITDRWGAGHRFQYIDWGLSLARLGKESSQDGETSQLQREQWDESLWVKLKATEVFRPTVTLQRRDITRPGEVSNLSRPDADGDVLTLSADGAWTSRFSWRSSWQCEFINDEAWTPGSPAADQNGERSALSTGVSWRHSARAPSLDLSFTQESGYESEQQYRERSLWSLTAAQQLTRVWTAQANAGVADENELNGQELHRLTAGVSSTVRLSPRTQLSGEYRYRRDEKENSTSDKQFRLQLKMTW